MAKLVNGDESLFSYLPSSIIIDILTRLPTKTISRCCCVCKAWLKLISSPEFSYSRKLRPPATLMINKNSESFNVVELEDELTNHDFYFLPGSKMERPKWLPSSTVMFGSINGLLCFHDYHSDDVYLWNPTTLESITILSAGGVMEFPNVKTHGFGLSSINGHYKVVRVYQEFEWDGHSRRLIKSECHVYIFGQGCWRYKGHAPFLYGCRSYGVFLNGNLHWLIEDPDGHELISCFDLEKESFHPFPAPPELDQIGLTTLQVYKDDCLCLVDNSSDFGITIRVMNEYGVKESWEKQFVIDRHPLNFIGNWYTVVHVLKVFKDGEILLLWWDDVLISYNPKTNSPEFVSIFKFVSTPDESSCNLFGERYPCIEVIDYVPSSFSLVSFEMEMVQVRLVPELELN